MANTETVKALDEARDAWETFREKMWTLGREVRKTEYSLHRRVEAYPGWDCTRDVGAGLSMDGWLDEIATVLGVGPGMFCTMCGEQSSRLDDEGTCVPCATYPATAHRPVR